MITKERGRPRKALAVRVLEALKDIPRFQSEEESKTEHNHTRRTSLDLRTQVVSHIVVITLDLETFLSHSFDCGLSADTLARISNVSESGLSIYSPLAERFNDQVQVHERHLYKDTILILLIIDMVG